METFARQSLELPAGETRIREDFQRVSADGAERPAAALATLVDVLEERGRQQPNDLAFTFLKDGEQESGSLTFGELRSRARKAGAALRQIGASGERILLLYPQGLDFIVAFFAALYAGAVAVPAPHQQSARSTRIDSIIGDAKPFLALTVPQRLSETSELLARQATPPRLSTLEELFELPGVEEGEPLAIAPESLAFLQFTSGSTKAPKGVMITHANIMHNQLMIQQMFEHSRDTVFVSWLPMFHDMGLIGNVLQPVYLGCKCYQMSPAAFLQEPARWLRAITKYRGTTGGGPNFGYDLCVDRMTAEQRKDLDLSSWDCAYNGSEPVRARTLERFTQTFAEFGFRENAFYPCYGMAEATLLISGAPKSSVPVVREFDDAGEGGVRKQLVGCGVTVSEQALAIVDPATFERLPDGEVGEIWLAGPSVSPGYWNRPEETTESFGRAIAGTSEACFMRTGDLGLIDKGEIYITGRIKDLIIVRGKNHYPQDIEDTAQAAHPALRAGHGAAFTIEDGGVPKLVIANEVGRRFLREPPLQEIAGKVRAAVSKEHGLQVSAVVLLRTGTIPMTSSGKIQRSLCKKQWLDGTLHVVAQDLLGALKTKADVAAV